MNAEAILALFPSLSALSRAARDAILRDGRVVVVPPGTVLQSRGGICAGLPLVATGEIQVRASREPTRSLLLYSVTRGQTCVLTAGCILSDDKPFAADAVATEKTTALVIPSETLRRLFGAEPALRELVFSTVAGRLGDLLEVVEDVAFARLDRRIAEWLVGADAVALTHEEIAERFGTARQVVSRLLGEWQRRGWIRQERGKIEVADGAALGNLGDRPAKPDR